MTYLPVGHAAPGAAFEIDVRGKRTGATVARLPFVPRHTKPAPGGRAA
jgi:glycine cleavage system aminomethyltransferase T